MIENPSRQVDSSKYHTRLRRMLVQKAWTRSEPRIDSTTAEIPLTAPFATSVHNETTDGHTMTTTTTMSKGQKTFPCFHHWHRPRASPHSSPLCACATPPRLCACARISSRTCFQPFAARHTILVHGKTFRSTLHSRYSVSDMFLSPLSNSTLHVSQASGLRHHRFRRFDTPMND